MVRSYEVIATNDVPMRSGLQKNVQNWLAKTLAVLQWLSTHCKEEGVTYFLDKPVRNKEIRLYQMCKGPLCGTIYH